MVDDFQTERELAQLESIHERVEKLRSRLKNLELDTYCALGSSEEEKKQSAEDADGVAKKYT